MKKGYEDDGPVILYFNLEASLPEGHVFAFNKALGTFSHLSTEENHPKLLFETQLSNSEQSVLLPLLQSYPHYCPHEEIFANFYNGAINDKTIKKARERLQEAQFAGVWDYEMRPVRNVLSRVRLKIIKSGLKVRSILETGYLLEFMPE